MGNLEPIRVVTPFAERFFSPQFNLQPPLFCADAAHRNGVRKAQARLQ
jgi:hypothetical protein